MKDMFCSGPTTKVSAVVYLQLRPDLYRLLHLPFGCRMGIESASPRVSLRAALHEQSLEVGPRPTTLEFEDIEFWSAFESSGVLQSVQIILGFLEGHLPLRTFSRCRQSISNSLTWLLDESAGVIWVVLFLLKLRLVDMTEEVAAPAACDV